MALNEDQLQAVRYTLSSSGWRDVMLPSLIKRGQGAIKALVLSPTERGKVCSGTDFDTTDDVLRAIIRDIEWMTSVWVNELTVSDYNRLRDELDQANGTEAANQPR